MLSVTIKVIGTEKARETFRRLGVSISNFSKELKTTGEYLVGFIKGPVFETEGQVYGGAWRSLNPGYQAWKQTNYPGRGTLELTGTMRKSFQAQSSQMFLRVFNPTPYFIKHQLGRDRMPQRVMMRIDEARKQEIVKIIHKGLVERVRKARGV